MSFWWRPCPGRDKLCPCGLASAGKTGRSYTRAVTTWSTPSSRPSQKPCVRCAPRSAWSGSPIAASPGSTSSNSWLLWGGLLHSGQRSHQDPLAGAEDLAQPAAHPEGSGSMVARCDLPSQGTTIRAGRDRGQSASQLEELGRGALVCGGHPREC
jgi:hypothetical protein